MIDFIIKLENMLEQSGYEDWEIRYHPDKKIYSLTLDDVVVFMRKFTSKENERSDIK